MRKPEILQRRLGDYLQIAARAQADGAPQRVRYIIITGRYYYVSETRTGINGNMTRHRSLDAAKRRALAVVGREANADRKAAKARAKRHD